MLYGYGEIMTLLQSLAALLLGFIVQEAPNVREGTKDYADFKEDIGSMVEMHQRVATGNLVDKEFDVLLLSAVNYRESRMRLPAPQGDCRWGHKYDHLPSGSWPAGYKPKLARVCNAVGPMQLNRGAGYQSQDWPEAKSALPDARQWKPSDLVDIENNVRLAYVVLQHWKNTCRDADGTEAPMGVWLTAYRRGSCPTIGKSKRFYVDEEAKLRCKIANTLATELRNDDGVVYSGTVEVPCTYKDEVAPRE